MGSGTLDPTKYEITAGQGTLSTNPSKVIRILPNTYRLIWNAGDIATSGIVTVKVLNGISDVAGNLVAANTTRNSAGTKRIIGINCGNGASIYTTGEELYYTPPFVSDSGFQGNERAFYLTSNTTVYNRVDDTVQTLYVTNPAPDGVYLTIRPQWSGPSPISYSIPVPAGTYTVRLHFGEIYFNSTSIGLQVFDIKVNGVLEYDDFDILYFAAEDTAYIYEVTGVSPSGGTIDIDIVPEMAYDGYYRAAINGIEIVKP